ncbi:MAG: DUF2624 family protein [Bacilli bacterium]|nr:DUF2624 family protein [Bacilli bacterium]
MYEFLIKEYVNKLTEEDIKKYAKGYNIDINDDECKILYLYAKNYWREFYKGEPLELINELKENLRPNTFNVLYKFYKEIKGKIK